MMTNGRGTLSLRFTWWLLNYVLARESGEKNASLTSPALMNVEGVNV